MSSRPRPHPVQEWLTEDQWNALLAARAGRRIYIPAHPTPEHPLARIVGYRALEKLAFYCPGHHDLPKYRSAWDRLRYWDGIKAEIRRLATQGMTREQIASKLKVSTKTVYRALRSH
ncbi:MAG: helix-turn-helix domain-containing protein [Gloeomargarita sp. SKYG116]|nr:helix-turn-helix domain-containing protein [Gloeomargarita sp. SKYG116]MDW8401627.1 helix-turn-helix domain-containing protein [Gloeomargarita sp. SKYGB_i_bin116]